MATPTEPTGRHRAAAPFLARLAGAALVVASIGGCGEAQVPTGHRDLVLRLATGTSTRDQGIMDRAAADISQLAADNALTDDEAKAFRSILDAAKSGQWDLARDLAYSLRDGQNVTAEDLDRLAKRPLPPMKKPGLRKTSP